MKRLLATGRIVPGRAVVVVPPVRGEGETIAEAVADALRKMEGK